MKPELARKLRCRNSGLRLLLQKLTGELLRGHAHLRCLARELALKLRCGHAQLTSKLLRCNSGLRLLLCRLRRQLLARKTKRTRLLCCLGQKLVCGQACGGLLLQKLTGKLFRRNPHLGGLPSKLTLKLCC